MSQSLKSRRSRVKALCDLTRTTLFREQWQQRRNDVVNHVVVHTYNIKEKKWMAAWIHHMSFSLPWLPLCVRLRVNSLDYWSVTVATENMLHWALSPRETWRQAHTERETEKGDEGHRRKNRKKKSEREIYREQMKDGTKGQEGKGGPGREKRRQGQPHSSPYLTVCVYNFLIMNGKLSEHHVV